MTEKQTIETITIYISSDGKEFKRKGDCEYHEKIFLRNVRRNEVMNLNATELNNEINVHIINHNKQYSLSLIDAFELAETQKIFDDEDYMFYKECEKWCIGNLDDGYRRDYVFETTLPIAICRFVLLRFHKLYD